MEEFAVLGNFDRLSSRKFHWFWKSIKRKEKKKKKKKEKKEKEKEEKGKEKGKREERNRKRPSTPPFNLQHHYKPNVPFILSIFHHARLIPITFTQATNPALVSRPANGRRKAKEKHNLDPIPLWPLPFNEISSKEGQLSVHISQLWQSLQEEGPLHPPPTDSHRRKAFQLPQMLPPLFKKGFPEHPWKWLSNRNQSKRKDVDWIYFKQIIIKRKEKKRKWWWYSNQLVLCQLWNVGKGKKKGKHYPGNFEKKPVQGSKEKEKKEKQNWSWNKSKANNDVNRHSWLLAD